MSFIPETRTSAEADIWIGVSFNFTMIIAVHLGKYRKKVSHYKSNDPWLSAADHSQSQPRNDCILCKLRHSLWKEHCAGWTC